MTPPAEPERPRVVPPRREWAGLAPLQRTLGTTTLLSSSARFASTLATRSAQPLVQPLTHGVMQDAPAGRLRGVARPSAPLLPQVDQSHHEELPLAAAPTTAQRTVLQRQVPLVSAPAAGPPRLVSAPRPETPERRVRAVPAPVQREMRGTFRPVGSPVPAAQPTPTSDPAKPPPSDGGDADLPLAGDDHDTQVAEPEPEIVEPASLAEAPSDRPVQAEAPTLAAGDRGGAAEPVARSDSDPAVQLVADSPAPDAPSLPVARVQRDVDDGERGGSGSPSVSPGSGGLGAPLSRPSDASSASGSPTSSPMGSASVQRATAGDAARPAPRRVGLGEPLVHPVQRSAAPGRESSTPARPDTVAQSDPGSSAPSPSAPDEPAAGAPAPADQSSAPLIGERSSPAALGGAEQPAEGPSTEAGPVVSPGDGGSDLPLQRSAAEASSSPGVDASHSPAGGTSASAPVGGASPGVGESATNAPAPADQSSAPLIGERSSPAALGSAEQPAAEGSSAVHVDTGTAVPSGDDDDLPLQRSVAVAGASAEAGSPPDGVANSSMDGAGDSQLAGEDPTQEASGRQPAGSSSAPLIGERSSPGTLGASERVAGGGPPTAGSPAAGSASTDSPAGPGARALPLQRAVAGPGSTTEQARSLASSQIPGHDAPGAPPAADVTASADAPAVSEDPAGPPVEPASTASAPPTTLAADAGPSIGPMPLQMLSAPLLAHRPPLLQRMLEPDADVPGSPGAPWRGSGTSGGGPLAHPASMSPTAPLSSTAPSSRVSPSSAGRPAVQRMAVQPLRRVANDLGGAAEGRGERPSASTSTMDGVTTLSATPDATDPGDGVRPVSGAPDVTSPSAASGWERAADVVTPWTPPTSWGSLQELGAPAGTGLATLQRTAEGMPASMPQTLQRLQATALQRVQGTQAQPAQLWSAAAGPAGQTMAPGETSWLAPAGANGELDLAKPAAAPATATTALQRDAAAGISDVQPAAQPAPVVAQPVPEVQRQEAPASDAAPASPPPTATVGSESANAASGGTTPQTEEELDVLAGRLYDHIATRLRRELRMDRERTGLLTDLS